jgi:hypothetical protein
VYYESFHGGSEPNKTRPASLDGAMIPGDIRREGQADCSFELPSRDLVDNAHLDAL